ncbi:hypothetical protein LTR04_002870 [Oleoguttula sp. CCFEE 6159]|nr:hypothetical protein LTR04_002870 [Oleoguttula sp. CCFEE 6159]
MKGDLTDLAHRPTHDEAASSWYDHSSGRRVSTDTVVVEALRSQYPNLNLTIVPQYSCNLLAYAAAGHATTTAIDTDKDHLAWRQYLPPARRLDHQQGALVNQVLFGKYLYKWQGKEFVVYFINGRDGSAYFPNITNQYVLSSTPEITNQLIVAAGKYGSELHNEVWVFDKGFWQKSADLWDSVQSASWDDVILEEKMKSAIINDVEGFFNSRATYRKLKVPWKRGIIYYGPPGNGKTISIKAMMHSLYKRKEPIPTLYVRTLASFGGPEYALSLIFSRARQTAPCYLVFEDLDSIVSDGVRSYFLNEVDGLQNNDGILMVGSTNHLDQLDPGISKRPSRFDRKYYFPIPNLAERVQYCKYWQHKLSDNKDIEFPDKLCVAIAKITDGFSFAYMQEAFVAALLAIAAGGDKPDSDATEDDEGDGDLESLLLWREIKKQVQLLKDEFDKGE